MDQTKQAVVMIDERLHLDFAAHEFIAPVIVGKDKFYVHFKPYTVAELQELSKGTQAKLTSRDGNTRLEPGNDERYLPFFDTHFVRATGLYTDFEKDEEGKPKSDDEGRYYGIEADPASQLAYLSDNIGGINAKKFAVGQSYLAIKKRTDEEAEPKLGLLISSLGSTTTEIETEVKTAYMNGSRFPTDVDVPLTFRFKKESPQDRLAYRRADEAREFDDRSAEIRIPTNVGELIRLFDSLILSIDGAMLNGVPCDESNKREWLGKVLPYYKIALVRWLFKMSASKN